MSQQITEKDIYSPTLCNDSQNDSLLAADGSMSEFFCGTFASTGFKKDSKVFQKSLEPIKDEDFDEQQNEMPVESFEASKKNKRKNSDLFSRKNTHLLFLDSKNNKSTCSTDSNLDASTADSIFIPQNLTERSTPIKDTKSAKKQNKERSTKRSSKSKPVLDKFITVRRDSRILNASPGLPSTELSDHPQSIENEDVSCGLSEANGSSNVDCSSQTDLTLADLQKMDLKSKSGAKSECTVKMSGEPSLFNPVTHSDRFQGHFPLEKFKDSLQKEFDDIRQILYFQQLTLSKILYENLAETERTNSGLKMVAESLNSIIDVLKVNQQLKKTDFS